MLNVWGVWIFFENSEENPDSIRTPNFRFTKNIGFSKTDKSSTKRLPLIGSEFYCP